MQAYQKEGSKSKKSKTKKNRANLQESIRVLDETLLLEIASDGLQALCYELGLEALHQILEQDVEKMAGPKGKHNPNRQAYRHGTEKTKVVLGGEKLRIDKPRVRSKDGGELNLPSLSVFQSEDPLNQAILSRILCGVSTRKYRRTVESAEGICTNKSEVSRRYHQSLTQLMDAFFKRPIQNTYPILMLDGMAVGKMMVITALGITDQGEKHILGLLTGATENSSVVKEMLADLIQRGLDPKLPRLFVLDGSKALNKAVKDTFGDHALIQRCQVHKKRNVLAHLPKSEQSNVGLALSKAYLEFDHAQALQQLNQLANNLERRYPAAAASLREGLEETLTVHRLNLPGKLRKTLSNTNPIESANSVAARIVRRVSSWQHGEMVLRHLAAAYLEAEKGFHRIAGFRELPILIAALDKEAGFKKADHQVLSA